MCQVRHGSVFAYHILKSQRQAWIYLLQMSFLRLSMPVAGQPERGNTFLTGEWVYGVSAAPFFRQSEYREGSHTPYN